VIIGSSTEDIRTNLSLSFVSVRGSAKTWRENFRKQSSQPAAVIRNNELVDAYMKFKEACGKGEYTPDHFAQFFQKNYGDPDDGEGAGKATDA